MLILVSTVSQPVRCQRPAPPPFGVKANQKLPTTGKWLHVGEQAQSLPVTGRPVWTRGD